jgi:hypothetical protein
VNYRTAGTSCPGGYQYYSVARTIDADIVNGAYTYVCLPSNLNTTASAATFGGMYQTNAIGGGIVNPYTNRLACPSPIGSMAGIYDYIVPYAITDVPAYPSGSVIHLCANFATNNDGNHFGGIYSDAVANPKTNTFGCAKGYEPTPLARLMNQQRQVVNLFLCFWSDTPRP